MLLLLNSLKNLSQSLEIDFFINVLQNGRSIHRIISEVILNSILILTRNLFYGVFLQESFPGCMNWPFGTPSLKWDNLLSVVTRGRCLVLLWRYDRLCWLPKEGLTPSDEWIWGEKGGSVRTENRSWYWYAKWN